MSDYALVATLGTEPQVVTRTLDLLERREGHLAAHVSVVHTSDSRVLAAKSMLEVEFARGYKIVPSFYLVREDTSPVQDITDEAKAKAFLGALARAILDAKNLHLDVHLSLAGGTKVMAMQGMVAAQWLLGEDDRLWHLLTEHRGSPWEPGDPRDMHARPDTISTLIPVPVLRWGNVAPMLILATSATPGPLLSVEGSAAPALTERKRAFIQDRLTRAERELLPLASQPMDNAAIARNLVKSEKTIAHQLTSIYEKLEASGILPDGARANRAILIAEFGSLYRKSVS